MNNNRARLINVRENRSATPFECRANDSGQIVLTGYAATYEPYELLGGPDAGGWREQIQPTAFDVTLAEKPDVQLLVNHEGMPLARTTSGTLQLSRDRHGLKVRALLDRDDPDVQRLLPKMKPQANGRSNMDQMSFGFRVKDQIWDSSYTQRTITQINLHLGDVSIVNYGANHTTSAALEALAHLSSQELLECRANPEVIEAALTTLGALRTPPGNKEADDMRSVEYIDTVRAANGSVTTLVAVLSDGSRVPLPTQYGSPAAAVVRSEGPEDEIEEPGVESFRPDAPNTIDVGPVTAVVSDLDEKLRAVRDAGSGSLMEAVREALVSVSLPPTLGSR